jgi:hypothetical protein
MKKVSDRHGILLVDRDTEKKSDSRDWVLEYLEKIIHLISPRT